MSKYYTNTTAFKRAFLTRDIYAEQAETIRLYNETKNKIDEEASKYKTSRRSPTKEMKKTISRGKTLRTKTTHRRKYIRKTNCRECVPCSSHCDVYFYSSCFFRNLTCSINV